MGHADEQPLPVMVDSSCFLALVHSAVEVYNRETSGLLVGAERHRRIRGRTRRVLVLEGAYPYQTAARSVTWVSAGNSSAVQRARSAVDALGFRIVGEYHSHTNNEHGLSHADVEYAASALRRRNGSAPRRWLELILGMRRKEYASARSSGFTWRDYPRKVGCTVTLAPRTGFDITLAGYWISAEGEQVRCEEATIYAPWDKRVKREVL